MRKSTHAAPSLLTRRDAVRLLGAGALAAATGALAGCSTLDALAPSTHVVTDDTGRQVEVPVPGKLKRIYFTSPLAQTFCFTMAPDLLAATSMVFTEQQLEFLPEGTQDLAYLGTLAQGGQLDLPALEREGVQVIFSISGTNLTDVNVADALEVERESGIPAFLIDGSFGVIGDTYRTLGACLGRPERGEELAQYCESVRQRVTDALASVPDSQRVRYYYAEGPEGLQTEPDSSQHSLVFREARGANVAAQVEGVTKDDLVAVSMEQVAAWDPDVIVAWSQANHQGADTYIRASSDWAGISAVRNGRVFTMPDVPFPFCDRPPGINRFLGVQWLANLFYPSRYDVDMVDVVREFYSKCYWRDITVDQARLILGT